MFPKLYEETRDLSPQIYFGGQEVPPYCHLRVPTSGPLAALVASIRSIGGPANSAGYIDGDGVHFHVSPDDIMWVDLSREYVFVCQPADTDSATPSAWQVLFYLMEPVRKVLFICAHDAVLLEKTPQTMQLCLALDQLYAQEAFLDAKIAMVESDEAREEGLARLMRVYEDETLGRSSEMWRFWDVFGEHLMRKRLRLRVETVATPPAV